jgi:acyl carrier protein
MPHHIVWDGWSFDLLYQEMAALYPAALEGRPERLPAPPVTYLDYAHWHAQWMASDECAAQVRFWKQRYARAQTPRALPTDRPRRGGMSGSGAVEWVHVDKLLTERLREVARGFGATLNMLVMAVYSALLGQATGSRSVVLGIPVRGRLTSEAETVMGFFNNMLPTPLEIDPTATLAAWTDVVKRELLDSFANQDVPFERFAGEPEVSAHAGRSGLYQSLFSFQDARERPRHWGPLSHASVLVMQKGATEDFGLWLMEVPSGLEGGVNYNQDLFEAATARLFRERLVALLRRVAETPGLTLAELLAQPGEDTTRFAAWVAAREGGPPRAVAADVASAPAVRAAGEQALATIWARLLGIDAAQIAAQDNFFDLGGNSLLVMQAVAAAQAELGLVVEPRRYVHETLAQLAGAAGAAPGAAPATLAGLWGELLGIDPAQIHAGDNFFDLGGNSLLAMRAIAEGERRLGLRIDPRRYVHETLQQLAATPVQAAPAAAPTPDVDAPGLLSRVLARFRRQA